MQLARPAAAAPLAAHPSLPRRAERILCMALEYEGEASKPTCACWVGERANCFAVGYDDGSVLLWGVPSQALQGEPWGGGCRGVCPAEPGRSAGARQQWCAEIHRMRSTLLRAYASCGELAATSSNFHRVFHRHRRPVQGH